jgi:hypothetical protein
MNTRKASRYTAADIETLTDRVVDRKTAENWHNRGLWLIPSKSPARGKPRLYLLAHLFEAKTRAALIEGGFTHGAARTAIELRLVHTKLPDERRRWKEDEVAEAIYSLPEFQRRNEDWYWVINFRYDHDRKVSEPSRTIAINGKTPVAKVCPESVASVLHISAIVREVFEYVAGSGSGALWPSARSGRS